MFGPVITAEAHLAFAGARTHSNNTAEMSAMIEPLFFLGPHGPVARGANSCIFYDSKHAAGVCLGTIRARTHVQLALACPQSMLSVQHRPRFTTRHVYGHAGNLGNECTDHAPRVLVKISQTTIHVQIWRHLPNIFVDATDLARIALSCHFALNFLCDKEGAHESV